MAVGGCRVSGTWRDRAVCTVLKTNMPSPLIRHTFTTLPSLALPDNIMMNEKMEPVLIDFSLAKFVGQIPTVDKAATTTTNGKHTGDCGTATYMAPEVYEKKPYGIKAGEQPPSLHPSCVVKAGERTPSLHPSYLIRAERPYSLHPCHVIKAGERTPSLHPSYVSMVPMSAACLCICCCLCPTLGVPSKHRPRPWPCQQFRTTHHDSTSFALPPPQEMCQEWAKRSKVARCAAGGR